MPRKQPGEIFFNCKADVPNTQQTASFIAYPQRARFIDISFLFSLYDTKVKAYCHLQENFKSRPVLLLCRIFNRKKKKYVSPKNKCPTSWGEKS